MNLENTLHENLRRRTPREVLEPVMEKNGVKWRRSSRKSLEELAEKGTVIRPDAGLWADVSGLAASLQNCSRSEKLSLSRAYESVVEAVEGIAAGSQVYVLPLDEIPLMPGTFDTSIRFRKWGNLVSLRRFASIKDAEDTHAMPNSQLRHAVSRTKLYDFYTGYSFEGARRGEGSILTRVMLEDCTDGAMIFAYCTSDQRGDKTTSLKLTQLIQPGIEPEKEGGLYVVQVPSVSREDAKAYRIVMKSVPIKKKGKDPVHYSSWLSINSEHLCTIRQESANTKRSRGGSRDFCMHMASAMLYLAYELKRIDHPFEIAFLPNAIPTESQYEFAMKLRNCVLAEVRNERGKLAYRTLTKLEREVLQWKRVALRGYEETLAASRGFQEYILGRAM